MDLKAKTIFPIDKLLYLSLIITIFEIKIKIINNGEINYDKPIDKNGMGETQRLKHLDN